VIPRLGDSIAGTFFFLRCHRQMKTGTHGSCRLRAEQKGQFNGLRWTRIAYVGRSGFDDSAACRILEKQHQIDTVFAVLPPSRCIGLARICRSPF
jgi:hypothetical protein